MGNLSYKMFLKIKICQKEKGNGSKWGGPGNNRQLETVNIQNKIWRKWVYWKKRIKQDLIVNNFHCNIKIESNSPEIKANFRNPLRNGNSL